VAGFIRHDQGLWLLEKVEGLTLVAGELSRMRSERDREQIRPGKRRVTQPSNRARKRG
jgi:hypothetical protein